MKATVRHRFGYSALPLASCIGFVVMSWVSLWGLRQLYVQASAGNPEYAGILFGLHLTIFGCLFPFFVTLCVLAMRSSWFLLNQYTLEGGILEAYDPVRRVRTRVPLRQVRRIGSFVVFGPEFGSLATRGHVLKVEDGSQQEIRVTEELRIWPDILRECEGATVDPMPKPWWEPQIVKPSEPQIPWFIGNEAAIRHSCSVRTSPLAACFSFLLMGLISLWGLWDLYVEASTGNSVFTRSTFLVGGTVLILLLTVILALGVRHTWFLMNEYKLEGGVLEAYDPVRRIRTRIPLRQVRRIGSFVVIGPERGNPSTLGHVLRTEDGSRQEIRVTEALPIWPDILRECEGAIVDPMPKPWWNVPREVPRGQ